MRPVLSGNGLISEPKSPTEDSLMQSGNLECLQLLLRLPDQFEMELGSRSTNIIISSFRQPYQLWNFTKNTINIHVFNSCHDQFKCILL